MSHLDSNYDQLKLQPEYRCEFGTVLFRGKARVARKWFFGAQEVDIDYLRPNSTWSYAGPEVYRTFQPGEERV